MRHPRSTDHAVRHDEPRDDPRDERLATIRGQQLLAELAARAEMERRDSPYYTDPRVVGWLAREVGSPHRASEGWSRDRIHSAAARLRAKVEAARLKVRLAGPPPVERAPVAGMIAVGAPGSVARDAPATALPREGEPSPRHPRIRP